MTVQKVETVRLILRGHRPSDFEHSAKLWGDPEVVRYVGGKPLSKEEVWARMLRYVGHWAWMGYGYWVIEEKTTGQFVGEAGFGNYKRDTQPSITSLPESGWVLATAFHGKGLCNGSGPRGSGMGSSAPEHAAGRLHHCPGKCAVSSRDGKMRFSGMAARRVSRQSDDSV
jgi:hypothetical protein